VIAATGAVIRPSTAEFHRRRQSLWYEARSRAVHVRAAIVTLAHDRADVADTLSACEPYKNGVVYLNYRAQG